VPFYFGGTSLLIVVTVTMDTVAQIQSHLLAHQYEGLIKKSKLRGRRGMKMNLICWGRRRRGRAPRPSGWSDEPWHGPALDRRHAARGHGLGQRDRQAGQGVMEAGKLVSDDIVVGMIEERIAQPDCAKGASSSTVSRARWPRPRRSTTCWERMGWKLDGVIEMAVDDESLADRIDRPLHLRQVRHRLSRPFQATKVEVSATCAARRNSPRRNDDNAETVTTRLVRLPCPDRADVCPTTGQKGC
jgi:adenylate kinase family enzyme